MIVNQNIIARRYFYPGCHRMEPYRSYFPHAGLLLPETEKLVKRILILPTGTAISETEIRQICRILQLSIANAKLLNQKIEEIALLPEHQPIKP